MSICANKTRWESSKKSLFVRTVWIRGYRHVILFDEDPIAQYLKSYKSRASSSLSKSSTRKVLSPNVSNQLRVPSVKFLLAEICKYEKEALQKQLNSELKKTLSIQVIPCNLRQADVVITQDKHFRGDNLLNAFRISRVVSSFDSDYKQINECDCDSSEQSHQLNEYRLNSLSDRVLCWLDLAIQSDEKCRCAYITEKLKTDYREILNQRSKLAAKKFTFNRSRSCDYQDNQILEEWSKKRRHFLKTTDMSLSSLNVNNVPFTGGDILRVTSYSEESAVLSKLPVTKQCTEMFKRQLHVFIPNIPKKNDDASSISSKSSSIIKPCST